MNEIYKLKYDAKDLIIKLGDIREKLSLLGFKKSSKKIDSVRSQITIELDLIIKNQEKEFIENKKRKCEDCDGKGFFVITKEQPKANYPTNLPDSGWVMEEVYVDENCKACSGKGYLESIG